MPVSRRCPPAGPRRAARGRGWAPPGGAAGGAHSWSRPGAPRAAPASAARRGCCLLPCRGWNGLSGVRRAALPVRLSVPTRAGEEVNWACLIYRTPRRAPSAWGRASSSPSPLTGCTAGMGTWESPMCQPHPARHSLHLQALCSHMLRWHSDRVPTQLKGFSLKAKINTTVLSQCSTEHSLLGQELLASWQQLTTVNLKWKLTRPPLILLKAITSFSRWAAVLHWNWEALRPEEHQRQCLCVLVLPWCEFAVSAL